MRSLPRALAVRVSGVMFLALTAIAGWKYVSVQSILREQLDLSLRRAAEVGLAVVAADGSPPAHAGSVGRDDFVRERDRLMVTRDPGGRILAVNTELARGLPLDSAGFARAVRGESAFATTRWLDGSVRMRYEPVRSRTPGSAAVLQVAASLDPVEAAARGVLYRMLGVVLLGTLATFLGVCWLGRSSLAPVAEIARQAKTITGRAAGERITAHADVSEFSGLIEVLNEMLDRLDRAHDWHRRILRDLGHDLRTPIAALRAGTELGLSAERSPDEYRRVLTGALEEVDRLTLISDALVLLGRLESGALVPRFAATDAHAIVSDSLARAQERTGAHRCTLTRSADGVLVQADARLLGLALDQVLDNAIRHTPPGTTIDMSVRASGEQAELVVEDDGPGVPDETLPHLFDLFYRVDAARGRAAGPGLGLTAAAAVVALHHGKVRAERARAGGLRVRITLPLHQPAPVPSPAPEPVEALT
ncbi:MAG: ATP-binding protein [Deltaproteobacteria bacterium]